MAAAAQLFYMGFTRNAPLVILVESVSVKLKVPTQSGDMDVTEIVPYAAATVAAPLPQRAVLEPPMG